jgi:thiamine-monophosphate kinase
MIDISDGLAQDLGHICEQSNVGAIVDRESIPVSPLLSLLGDSADERFRLAASGGEDFELLFTAAPESEETLRRLVGPDLPLTRIGTITERGETPVLLREREGVRPLDLGGYNHFKDRSPSPPASSED